MGNKPSPIEVLTKKQPWIQTSNPIWLASTVSLERNVERFKFPHKLDVERKKQIVSLVSKELEGVQQLSNPLLYKAEELTFFDKEYLVEHFFKINNLNQTGTGEAFLIDEQGETLLLFNLTDHLSLYKIDTKGDLESAWLQLVKIETLLGKNLTYSFSQKFGFLTANFEQCGTALQVTTYLHLPALMHLETINAILEKEGDDSFSIMGIQGSPTEIIGDIFAIQNNYTLGLSEENIISSIRSISSKLLLEEKNARNNIKQNINTQLIDKVSRAFGILLYSYQIEAVEALNALSLCKLGAAMGWIAGITENDINTLLLNCRRAHLLNQFPEKMTIRQDEVPHKRAEFIHKALKPAKLLV